MFEAIACTFLNFEASFPLEKKKPILTVVYLTGTLLQCRALLWQISSKHLICHKAVFS